MAVNYITVENISKSYGELELFRELSFSIHKDEKIAFVAKNGSGKTSILNILSGSDIPDSGQVVMRNGLRLGFLPQSPQFDDHETVASTLFNADLPVLKLVEAYETALLHPEDEVGYQKAFEQMEIHNAWDFELQCKQILFQLKLDLFALQFEVPGIMDLHLFKGFLVPHFIFRM